MKCSVIVLIASLAAFWTGCGSPPVPDDQFLAMEHSGTSGILLPYRLFVPDEYDPRGQYPMVVFLHGGRGAGTDNISQISGPNRSGARIWIEPENQAKHPAFVLAPQLPRQWRWDSPSPDRLSDYAQVTMELIEKLQVEYSIDRNRIYITGQSMGGWGVWDIVAKHPDVFAAAVPVCGGGNSTLAKSMRGVSIWTFHGARDTEVRVERSREMVEAVKKAGGDIRYTEYGTLGHAIWDRAYRESELADWLFAQRRGR